MFWSLNKIARRKLNQPDTWECCRVKHVGTDIICEGGIPQIRKRRVIKTKKRWPRHERQTIVITQAELDAEIEKYVSAKGLCANCFGGGQTVDYSRATGLTFETCPNCNGSGKSQPKP